MANTSRYTQKLILGTLKDGSMDKMSRPVINQTSTNANTNGNANAYRKMTHKQHILEIPDTYVGSDEQIAHASRLLVPTEQGFSIVQQTISVPEAVSRLFNEILSNASDNADRSRKNGIPIGRIQVYVDQNTVIIRNGGVPIPIELHPQEGVYIPELIFGNLLTSSNYNKEVDRTGCGRNGYGAKLTNIYSLAFQVRIGDSQRKLEYIQLWQNNMDICHPPNIQPYEGESYVEISYQLDFKRFGYQHYPDEAIWLFGRYAADTSLMMKIPVEFNGHLFDYTNIRDYAKLLFGSTTNMLVIELPNADPNSPPSELCIIDSPENAMVISSINGMMTLEGGVHVDAAYQLVTKSVLASINGSIKVKPTKDGKEPKVAKLTKEDLMPHLSMLVICHLPNPKFNAQTKTILKSPKPKFEIAEKDIKKMLKWQFADYLYATLDMKQDRLMAKTDGKKRKHVNIAKLDDANLAGDATRSRECTLYVTEGNSAMGYALNAISLIPNGREFFGIYPMKGKPLNVMNASGQQLVNNKEITELKAALGLQEKMDYSIEANFNTLRYGHFVILADSDDDGKHIVGLILNIFYCKWPSLLARGYVMFLRTPILRATKGTSQEAFYTDSEYELWKQRTPDADKWSLKYFKGLGTSTRKHIEEDMKDPKVVICVYDNMAPHSIQLAFNDKLADHRKRWIAEYKHVLGVTSMQMQPISDFINTEFIKFSIANITRSIPSRTDGLKPSQRKAIWGSFIKWKGKDVKKAAEFKVARFANFVAEATDYHHGEKCMCDTIVGMAQNFAGSNNMPYFTDDGSFGSRTHNGKDASDTRYIFTRPNWWLKLIFMDSDLPLLELLPGSEKGETIEPKFMLPILPLHLVNGSQGIGTAWSTYIPPYNPKDLIASIRSLLEGRELAEILPWYRGFTGTVRIVTRDRKVRQQPVATDDSVDEDPLGQDEEFIDESTRSSLIVEGSFIVPEENPNIVIVTELPIGRSIHDYKTWLEHLVAERKIKDFSNKSKINKPRFVIEGFELSGHKPSLKTLRLVKTYGLSNMVLLDENYHPRRYNGVADILRDFYQTRLPFYQLRKDSMVKEINTKIANHNNKIRFIRAILNKELIVERRRKVDIQADMERMQIPKELLDKTKLTAFTLEDIAKLEQKITSLIQQRDTIQNKRSEDLWTEDLNEFEREYDNYYLRIWKEDAEIVETDDFAKPKKSARKPRASGKTTGKTTGKKPGAAKGKTTGKKNN